MLLLTAGDAPPPDAIAEILGAGLSCDAYHPASPHPEGKGAAGAMRAALSDAGILPEDIDYINLHGTGTIDNDLSEAKAVRAVFGSRMPYLSSTKGAFGHSLAASGAIEAAVSAICITEGIIPANTGCSVTDPALGIEPEKEVKTNIKVNTVLSNSFGFRREQRRSCDRQNRKTHRNSETFGAKSIICSCKSVLNRSRQYERDY